MILHGTPKAKDMKEDLKKKVKSYFGEDSKVYIAILFLGNNSSSATYVKFKKKYGEEIGIDCKIFRDEDLGQELSVNIVLGLIQKLNNDENCIGIMLQLPLPTALQSHKAELLASIAPEKDIDGLGGIMSGLSAIDLIDFLPATPKAVIEILVSYKLDNLSAKKVVIIGQSNLIGKPLAIECMKRGATVSAFNSLSDHTFLEETCKKSDIIISCTGAIHLVDERFVRDDNSQILIDVGYGHDKDGKAVGDIDIEKIKDKVYAYTPVPGGIGPLTIASLFDNIFVLQDLKDKLKDIL